MCVHYTFSRMFIPALKLNNLAEMVPCSRVGHVFRAWSPYPWRTDINVLTYNPLRVAAVWLDQYKEITANCRGPGRCGGGGSAAESWCCKVGSAGCSSCTGTGSGAGTGLSPPGCLHTGTPQPGPSCATSSTAAPSSGELGATQYSVV